MDPRQFNRYLWGRFPDFNFQLSTIFGQFGEDFLNVQLSTINRAPHTENLEVQLSIERGIRQIIEIPPAAPARQRCRTSFGKLGMKDAGLDTSTSWWMLVVEPTHLKKKGGQLGSVNYPGIRGENYISNIFETTP